MAGSVNKVILAGNVGKDPEIRTMQSGSRLANFSLATSESWKDKATGERKEATQWHRIVVFNDALVGIIERFVKKGSKLFVEGQLETRKWTDNEGRDQYTTEVVLRQFRGGVTLLDSRRDDVGGDNSYDENRRGSLKDKPPPEPYTPPDGSASDYAADLDDEIPF